MKNLILSLAAASVLFVIGCQENSITDPIANQPVEKEQIGTTDTYLQGTIRLEGALNDPYPIGNSFYRISGQIDFEQRTLFMDPMLPSAQRYASLYFITEASLWYVCTLMQPSELDNLDGFISNVSEDLVPLAGSAVSMLEKSFIIQGREDGMVLRARFLVTSSGCELSTMWLELRSDNVKATDINHY